MQITHDKVMPLLDSLKMDRFYVVCYFRCDVTKKTIVSTVPFEPYDGKIELTWQDKIFHPIKSYNRYHHTPITIYNSNCHESIVLKAFEKISNHFTYNRQKKRYVYVA